MKRPESLCPFVSERVKIIQQCLLIKERGYVKSKFNASDLGSKIFTLGCQNNPKLTKKDIEAGSFYNLGGSTTEEPWITNLEKAAKLGIWTPLEVIKDNWKMKGKMSEQEYESYLSAFKIEAASETLKKTVFKQ